MESNGRKKIYSVDWNWNLLKAILAISAWDGLLTQGTNIVILLFSKSLNQPGC